ncbi:MAG: PAAR domain-containing protein, partial [Pricia sp.]
MGKSAAILTNNHICPLTTGSAPHVGGPILGPGAAGVTIDGQPAAIVGDICTCCGPPD